MMKEVPAEILTNAQLNVKRKDLSVKTMMEASIAFARKVLGDNHMM